MQFTIVAGSDQARLFAFLTGRSWSLTSESATVSEQAEMFFQGSTQPALSHPNAVTGRKDPQ